MIKSHSLLAKLLIAAPLISPLACAPVPQMTLEETAMVRRAIIGMAPQFMDAVSRGDAAAVAMYYTEEARLLPPNSDAVVGMEAIQAFFQESFEAGVTDFQLMPAAVKVMGDVAYERGEFQLTIQPEMGEPIMDRGKYVSIWKSVMGEWKIDIGIWNTSMPLPEPQPMMPEAMPEAMPQEMPEE